jgi:hypothetical protein
MHVIEEAVLEPGHVVGRVDTEGRVEQRPGSKHVASLQLESRDSANRNGVQVERDEKRAGSSDEKSVCTRKTAACWLG